jgi:hypothetical protein
VHAMMAQKAPARACLLILLLAHGVFGATAAAEMDTVLMQFGTIATKPECCWMPSWDAGFGGCELYDPDMYYFNYCDDDQVDGIYAKDVCTECGICGTASMSNACFPNDVLSGTGDPHLSNIRGDHFDIYQTGNMALLHLPRLAEPARTMLLVEADARRMVDACSVYFQVVTISGEWTNQSKPIQFFANTHGTPKGRQWNQWMHFGPIDLKVALHNKGVDYLNVYARNVGHSGYEVGGLLGLDDHTAVAERPRQCDHRHDAALFSAAEAK